MKINLKRAKEILVKVMKKILMKNLKKKVYFLLILNIFFNNLIKSKEMVKIHKDKSLFPNFIVLFIFF